MKKLVVINHPKIGDSVVNKRWIEELEKYPNEFTIHHLDTLYPDGKIDVEREQKIIEEHDAVILQFPLYWFNCPPLLKQWFDEVFTHGWAYGSKGKKLVNKKIALAISAGAAEEDYRIDGKERVTLEELTVPYSSTVRYVGADYRSHFVIYGAESGIEKEVLEKSASDYVHFAMNI